MSAAAPNSASTPAPVPAFNDLLGHPRPLWMLFMTEFWERFAFYGIRWALTLYIVSQFFGGEGAGEAPANRLYGAYLALVYASALFGGFVADRLIGYQRSILIGAAVMSLGLFLIAIPNEQVFRIGLATVIAGNGLFKPNISTMVGQLYGLNDSRRDSGFTIFYMGINAGAFIAPILTGILADKVFGSEAMPAYKYVFIASGVGMLVSLVWFWIGRRQLGSVGVAPAGAGLGRTLAVLVGTLVAVPVAYGLLTIDAGILGWILGALFVALCVSILVEGIREGKVARDRALAMLVIFVFNVLFFMFFEQAGSSFNFLAQNIVERDFGGWTFPVGWFQSVNSIAILTLGPVFVWLWVALGKNNPSIPRKFGLGLIFNGLAFALLMYALSSLVDPETLKVPFWTLFMVYVIQTVGELCLSPIGLSMTTKLAPVKVVGLAMGGWFLSTAIGNNLSGIFAAVVSGESGMTVESALKGYTFGFWSLLGAGVLLFLIAPLVQKLMHGVK
ncbi:dihydroorotate dehydrogenase [Stenotrophomonas daejeonensis]|uniref:Dihydroorotate dehydrogenase n=1 Tax=Stenotrophomonas daejeonensis TaxID=659018 RepID=A0A0R0E176_9GAMM|nr:oligopeptide:H+ symporter [Stenotrophomonas daejeonensis]KRG84161.1 dihydroorotate dehydrogenase [Stenotrophomonas daejeonensis]